MCQTPKCIGPESLNTVDPLERRLRWLSQIVVPENTYADCPRDESPPKMTQEKLLKIIMVEISVFLGNAALCVFSFIGAVRMNE